ncbi:uncharacterized protein LOC118756687 [Rhagoletis pomonella]|uniref:uncharacterized protein LOC118756687 n=1 Tax=Rhagoletis pomonella TaxID=28610 RepID=UPI00177BED31|nr:uncharacterized protein LOC118756687 [Rhagoletis pomonella]
MEDLRKLKVNQLRKKCKDVDISCAGNKAELINRLELFYSEEHFESASEHTMLVQRIADLEKTIHELQTRSRDECKDNGNNFVPQRISSPVEASVPPSVAVPASTVSYQVPWAQNLNSVTQAPYGQICWSHPPQNVYTQTQNTYTPHLDNVPRVVPPYTTAPFAVPPEQPISLISNPFCKARDVAELLPEFNPVSKTSLNSVQYIKRVETLKDAYCWNEKILIFAVQQKMRGPAKYWVDSLQEVFGTWQQFAKRFIDDFPCMVNSADVHIEMSRMKRQNNESPQEFFFKMQALGTKACMPENAIVRHVINGINDPDLKKKISNDYVQCTDLLRDINEYCVYNDIKPVMNTNIKPTVNLNKTKLPQLQGGNSGVRNEQKGLDNVKCYNCLKFGHFSKNCPEPQKKVRCGKCNRTNHTTEKCTENQKAKVNVIRNSDGIVKNVNVNGQITSAFIDPGSGRTLIRKSFAAKLGQTKPSTVVLKGFGGGEFICKEEVHVKIDIDNIKLQICALVVDDELISENILLGEDTLCQDGKRLVIENGVCQIERVFSINEESHLTSADRDKLKTILIHFQDAFSEKLSDLGKCNVAKMNIELNTNIPVRMKPYRVPFAKRPIVAGIIRELLDNDIIRQSDSAYASPIVLVEKKNGEHRLCVDYRCLNKITTKMSFPMPIMEEQFAQLAGNCYFTTLDLRMGYHQIEIDDESKKIYGFRHH